MSGRSNTRASSRARCTACAAPSCAAGWGSCWAEIAHLAAEGLTILLTTHYLEEADRLADRLAIVDRGRVVASRSPDGLKGELRGDAIQVELGDPESDGRAQGALAWPCWPARRRR